MRKRFSKRRSHFFFVLAVGFAAIALFSREIHRAAAFGRDPGGRSGAASDSRSRAPGGVSGAASDSRSRAPGGVSGAAHSEEVFVDRVVDGDTVVLSSRERVRYIGVDSPELHHPYKPVQAYAREAKEFNRNLVEGKRVRLEYDVERRDKYGRLLAYVYLPDGTFVNAELVRQGYAHLLTIPPNVKHADLFLKYQRKAREAHRGLWRQ